MRAPGYRLSAVSLVLALSAPGFILRAQVPVTSTELPRLSEADVRTWLTFLASDVVQGREVFTEGYGIASAYIAEELSKVGVKPLGDDGTYLQSVKQRGYKVTRNSSITVQVGNQTRTFKHGDHVEFPLESGSKQTLTFTGVEFVGYGQARAQAGREEGDFTGRDVKGKLVVFFPGGRGTASSTFGVDRSEEIVRSHGAAAAMTYEPSRPDPPAKSASNTPVKPDIVTVDRLDKPVAPTPVGDETFYEFLFGNRFADLKARFDKGSSLEPFSLPNVKVTINIDNTFTVTSVDLTQNVVGLVEGSDPTLRNTYVFFGAHLDHVGYSKNGEAKGRVNTPIDQDRIWNGADDDGSGSAALLAIAKAFASGPKPKRSVVFIWHAGEEAGLLGSRYMVDYPVVPLENVGVELNIDMIGRNRDDKESEANKLYVIGADRISTDLHNVMVATNGGLDRPLTLDYEYNDVNDPNSFYTRSDHYSYASRGIPIAFFFTGTHDDYHANTDSVDRILFPKLIRVAEMIYRLGFSLADSDRELRRDNLGSRSGRGFSGPLAK